MRSAWSPVSRSATVVYTALAALVVAVAGLAVFEETRGHRLARRFAAIGGDPTAPGAHQLLGEVTVFALLVIAVAVSAAGAGAALLAWLRRVRPGTPAVALAAVWLLPVVNLVAPPFLMDRAWRDAAADGRPGHPGRAGRAGWLVLLGCWWLSWLAALAVVFFRPARVDRELTGVDLTTLGSVAIAAVLCAAAVREITERCEGRGPGIGRWPPHHPGDGPELPELACQSRRRGSARNGPCRTP